ncbi:MAG: nuclear transport factor 2 family protein [Ferruginibacter sp.]
MKKQLTVTALLIALLATAISAQSKKQKQVAAAVENFRKAMINPTKEQLSALVADDLGYGHSGGKVEDKATFIETLLSGKSDFVTIDLLDQQIKVYGKTAVVRHILNAATNDDNKPGTVKLAILTVWHKENGSWKMVARQAVRPT